MAHKWMIYGATGYTGQLIAEMAVARGLEPTLAGRNPEKVSALADRLGLPWAAFSIGDQHAIEAALKGYEAVLSVAGPFSATAENMIAACLKTGTHYLDVTGEIAVFEHAASRSADAQQAGIVLLPGVGFDVVPSDCLAAHTAKRATAPKSLVLAIKGLGGPSQGTAKTATETLGQGTLVRKEGRLTTVPAGGLKKMFNLGKNAGAEEFIAVSWGDVSTAFHSTDIKDIEVYFPFEGPIKALTKMSRFAGPLMRTKMVQSFLKKQIDKMPAGPTDKERLRDTAILLAEVTDEKGQVFRSTLSTPNGYSLTADSAILCVTKLLAQKELRGFQTPSLAFGEGFITEVEGCVLSDLS
jgi:short subunit dehydrogenase-like uncharacterized protein